METKVEEAIKDVMMAMATGLSEDLVKKDFQEDFESFCEEYQNGGEDGSLAFRGIVDLVLKERQKYTNLKEAVLFMSSSENNSIDTDTLIKKRINDLIFS